jgi:surfactin synthase thioesterase subunit
VTPDQAARWSELTRDRFAAQVLEGDHFYLVPRRADVVSHVLRTVSMAWPSTP